MHLTRLRENTVQNVPNSKLKQYMNKKLSSGFFIISMIIIFIMACGFLIGLNFFINPLQKQLTALNYQPVTSAPVSLTLNLSSPDDNLLVFDPNLLVSGQSASGILVLVTVNDTNQTLNASQNGDFSLTVKLQPGSNQVIVSAFDNTGNYKSEERSIYYSEEKL